MNYINSKTGNIISENDYNNLSLEDKGNFTYTAYPITCQDDNTTNSDNNDCADNFTNSMVIGYVTNNGIVGGIVGGSLLGGIVGDMLNN